MAQRIRTVFQDFGFSIEQRDIARFLLRRSRRGTSISRQAGKFVPAWPSTWLSSSPAAAGRPGSAPFADPRVAAALRGPRPPGSSPSHQQNLSEAFKLWFEKEVALRLSLPLRQELFSLTAHEQAVREMSLGAKPGPPGQARVDPHAPALPSAASVNQSQLGHLLQVRALPTVLAGPTSLRDQQSFFSPFPILVFKISPGSSTMEKCPRRIGANLQVSRRGP